MELQRPMNFQPNQGGSGETETAIDDTTNMPMMLTHVASMQNRIEHTIPSVAQPLTHSQAIPFEERTLYPSYPPLLLLGSADSHSQIPHVPGSIPFNQNQIWNGDETFGMKPKEPENVRTDLSKIDAEIITRKLNELTDISQGLGDPLPPPEETFEHFGKTIADILRNHAVILDECQLHAAEEGSIGANGIHVDAQKLETMTLAATQLFENVTNLSHEMHEMTDKLKPFYTRYLPYFRNLEVRSGKTTSFSHTAGPETIISQHLVRLQNELLGKDQSG